MAIFRDRNDDLVVLAKFDHSPPAHSLRALLEAHGIKATVTNEESASSLGLSILGPMNLVHVEVCVLRADLLDAQKIMNQVPAAAEVLIPEWNCACGATVDPGFSVCWSCGSPREESA